MTKLLRLSLLVLVAIVLKSPARNRVGTGVLVRRIKITVRRRRRCVMTVRRGLKLVMDPKGCLMIHWW